MLENFKETDADKSFEDIGNTTGTIIVNQLPKTSIEKSAPQAIKVEEQLSSSQIKQIKI